MKVETTVDFILEQARAAENFAKASIRFAQAEKRLDRLERLVAQNRPKLRDDSEKIHHRDHGVRGVFSPCSLCPLW
jgi:hypothetical protein